MAAVKVLADRFGKAGGERLVSVIAGGEAALAAGVNRIVGGNPPTMMQFNIGRQLDKRVDAVLLVDLDAQATTETWKAVLPRALDQASADRL